MTLKLLVANCSFLCLAMLCTAVKSQTPAANTAAKPVLFDGVAIVGYVDQGAYINFAGPSIKFSKKPICILLGLLPGLRIKKDKVNPGSPQNSTITPSLGFGLTAAYKHLAIQAPLYYNAKTSTKNGKWNPGIGIGYKF